MLPCVLFLHLSDNVKVYTHKHTQAPIIPSLSLPPSHSSCTVCVFCMVSLCVCLDAGHWHVLGGDQCPGSFLCLLWNLWACEDPYPSLRCQAPPGPPAPLTQLHYSSLEPARRCDNSSYHEIKHGETCRGHKVATFTFSLEIALQGATRRKCKANSFSLSCFSLSLCPPPLCFCLSQSILL